MNKNVVMKPVHTFNLIPPFPAFLERLRELAYNLRWSWNHETISLFRCLDDDLLLVTGPNPVLMLGKINQIRLEQAASDLGLPMRASGSSTTKNTFANG